MGTEILFIGRGTLKSNASTLRPLHLSGYLPKDTYAISLMLPDEEDNKKLAQKYNDLEFVFCKRGWQEFFSRLLLLIKGRYDVLHVMNVGVNSFLVALIYKKLFSPKVKLVLDSDEWYSTLISSPLKRTIIKIMELLALRYSDVVIAASYHLKNIYERKRHSEVHYLPYAIEEKLISKIQEVSRQKRTDESGIKRILYLGTIQKHFDIDFIYDALGKRKAGDKYSFVIAGDGPYRDELEKKCAKENYNVQFLGYVEDERLPNILSEADILILPISNSEMNKSRCPNKMFVYMAAQKTILTNEVGEVKRILGDSAYYFNFASVEDFWKKLEESADQPKKIPSDQINRNTWKYRTQQYMQILEASE